MPDIAHQAAAEAGWLAGAFMILVLGGFATLGWLIRQLWIWLKELQVFNQNTLLTALQESTETMKHNTSTLHSLAITLQKKPCLLESQNITDKIISALEHVSKESRGEE